MKDVAYYRKLPYQRKVRLIEEEGDVYFTAFVEELPALEIDASTREEALLRLDEMFDDYIQAQLEWGEDVPEPKPWPGREDLPPETGIVISPTRALSRILQTLVRRSEDVATPDPEWLKDQWRKAGSEESTRTVGAGS